MTIPSPPALALLTTVRAIWHAQKLGYRRAFDVAKPLVMFGPDSETLGRGRADYLFGPNGLERLLDLSALAQRS